MTIPQTIYKYRDWSCENHKRILTNNEIFLSSPKNFNDPFDCKISTHYLSLDCPEKVEEYISGRKSTSELTESGLDILKNRLNDISNYWQMFEAIEFSNIDQSYGIISLSERWNSILMWSHYSNNHRGFCVGFNESKMRNSGLFSCGGSVIYSDDFPIINPLESDEKIMFLQTQYKAKNWEYEKEYRLSKLFFPSKPTLTDRKICLEDGFIEEVNLGLLISEKDREEITKICRTKSIKVYQLYRVPYRFELERFET